MKDGGVFKVQIVVSGKINGENPSILALCNGLESLGFEVHPPFMQDAEIVAIYPRDKESA